MGDAVKSLIKIKQYNHYCHLPTLYRQSSLLEYSQKSRLSSLTLFIARLKRTQGRIQGGSTRSTCSPRESESIKIFLSDIVRKIVFEKISLENFSLKTYLL